MSASERDHETAELLHRSDLARDVAREWVALDATVRHDVDPALHRALDRLAAHLLDGPQGELR